MKLSQNSGTPIYKQIADQFKEDILGGKYDKEGKRNQTASMKTVNICLLSGGWRRT